MERLYLPPSLRYLEPMRAVPGEPLDHASFVYDLVEALRPALVVDVGAGAGVAFSIACQSMRAHDVDGLAYAIDAWSDDEAKAEDDPTSWAHLNNFLRAYFRGVAYLLKTAPADALQHFADGSVSLLRLDAVRSGIPLPALAEAWLTRLAPGGVALFPGVNDEERPDIADDWKRATSSHASFIFPHGKGLGVVHRAAATDQAAVPELVELLTSSDEQDRDGLARFYEHADRHHSLRVEVNEKWMDLRRERRR